jgi:hypothetical protein
MEVNIIDEVPGLYRIISLHVLRRTPGVDFDFVPHEAVPRIDGIDRVVHTKGAYSPQPVAGIERPWYMHPWQEDNLLVLHGIRRVDLYSKNHGKVEHFEVAPDYIRKNEELLTDQPAMLGWPRHVFHRIHSDDQLGSASINFAVRDENIDLDTNFNIYDLNTETGAHRVIREGLLDQP